MDMTNNFTTRIYNFLTKYIIPDYTKTIPTNPSKEYLINYKKTHGFKKFPAIFTSPKYNPDTMRLEFGSFEYELEQAKKRPQMKYYYPITEFYWNKFTNQNSQTKFKKFPSIFVNLRYNPEKKRLESNSLDYELEKSGYYKK